MAKEEYKDYTSKPSAPPLTPIERVACGVMLFWAAAIAFILAVGVLCLTGCTTYKGGKVVDGSNLEIGMTVPGTDWSINFLSYTGGAKICGNDGTAITVTNCVDETNSYFGVMTTRRKTTLVAEIAPIENGGNAAARDDVPLGDLP